MFYSCLLTELHSFSTAVFHHGRTEAIRPATIEAANFVIALENNEIEAVLHELIVKARNGIFINKSVCFFMLVNIHSKKEYYFIKSTQ